MPVKPGSGAAAFFRAVHRQKNPVHVHTGLAFCRNSPMPVVTKSSQLVSWVLPRFFIGAVIAKPGTDFVQRFAQNVWHSKIAFAKSMAPL
jgi:hypothetical protein